jgi:hypothetical protein
MSRCAAAFAIATDGNIAERDVFVLDVGFMQLYLSGDKQLD